MKNLLKVYPLPISGFSLALSTMAAMTASHSQYLKVIFLSAAVIIFTLFVLKLVYYPKDVANALKAPLPASAFPTFFMAGVSLAGHLFDYNAALAKFFYYTLAVFYFAYVIYFSLTFLRGFTIKNVLTTWFIVYVGPAIFLVHSRIIDKSTILNNLLTFVCIAFVILLPIILYRIFVVGYNDEVARATLVVLSAPGSLLFLAYYNFVADKTFNMTLLVFAISQIFYIWVLFYLPSIFKGKLYPTIAAITFPMVTGAYVSKLLYNSYKSDLLYNYYLVQAIFVGIILIFVMYWYCKFLYTQVKN